MVRFVVGVARYKPRHAGVIASALLIAMGAGYGVYKGEHGAAIVDFLKDTRDAAANAAGFRITTLSITGSKQLSDEEVLAAAGITARTSLMFLDVDAARRRLESTPWVAQASVRKLYPGQLQIALEERQAFALWQKAGKLAVISSDGTVLGPVGERRIPSLPLVVGPGAAAKARDILTMVDRYPVIRDQLRASVLVAERRWNLKLKNGLDIRLPETEVERALDVLVALDRDKKLLSRDLTAIDLRLPERLTVRLSDEAAQAREQVQKDKKKRKGGDA
jgi:cell division protein FtsQ